MKKAIFKILIVSLLAFFLMGATSCQTKTDTVILPEGPIAAALGKTKDEQIKGLYERVLAEMQARELEQKRASLAAANFDSILFASGYVDIGLPRNAIEEEAKLGKERSPTPDPQEIIKGKDRVIAILENDVAKAKELYGKAFDEAKQAKAQIEQKDKEIAQRDGEIEKRNEKIAQLELDKAAEAEKHKNDIKDALAKKDREFADYKNEQASRERRVWLNTIRFIGLGFILAGGIAIVLFKIFPEGIGAIAVGITIGLISVGFDMLTQLWWFKYAIGVLILLIVGGAAWGLRKMWIKHELDNKKTAALQDLKDESTTLGSDTWNKVEEHLKYRLGDKNSFWNKTQMKEVSKLGLINPNMEKK